MSNKNVIAIFDVGKTNKKFFLLDESYTIVLERSIVCPEVVDEDGESCDDIEFIHEWIFTTLTTALQWEGFSISAINFSAYGASIVWIDQHGKVIAPLYNYLKKFPQLLLDHFYKRYGGPGKVSLETASPVLGSLNSGLQILRMKNEQPSLFNAAAFALHLPQFLSFLVSRQACSDITSIGCHTQLWNFNHQQYHQWVTAEGIEPKLAPIKHSDSVVETDFEGKHLLVGTGLHDSSAALIPYLALFKEPFILLSTGTWCISLNPFNSTPLTQEELAQDCLCYLEYYGKPVKASRLFAGHEHEQQTKRLAAHFQKKNDFYKRVRFDEHLLKELQEISLTGVDGERVGVNQSLFQTRDLSAFRSYEAAYHCLIFDIINQQHYSTKLVMTGNEVKRIFVDGGFSNNSIYMHLLAMVFPGIEVYAASVAQATAIGAALAIHHHWNPKPIPSDMVRLQYYQFIPASGVQH